MDNNLTSPDPKRARGRARLSAEHYAFYQQTYLELLTPEGQHLEYLGKTLRQEREEEQSYNLRDQVALVACLLGGVQDDIQSSLPAVLELTRLFCRMQEEWKRG